MPLSTAQLAQMLARLRPLTALPDSSVRAALSHGLVSETLYEAEGLPWMERVHLNALKRLRAEEQSGLSPPK